MACWLADYYTVRNDMKIGSLQRRAEAMSLLQGRLFFPRELVTTRGIPLESKNNFRREAFSTISFGGSPKSSIMQAICSVSCSPTKVPNSIVVGASVSRSGLILGYGTVPYGTVWYGTVQGLGIRVWLRA